MKCPFRTITTKECVIGKDSFSPTYGKVVGEVESVDFSECVGSECPYHYYGNKINTSSGYAQTKSVPRCKRAEV